MNVLIVEILSNQNQELLNGINLINKRIDNLGLNSPNLASQQKKFINPDLNVKSLKD